MITLAKGFGWNVRMTHKIVGSAYKSDPFHIIKDNNINKRKLIFYSVSRFSRNVVKGNKSMIELLKRGNVIYFVNEKLKIDGLNDSYKKFLKHLQLSQHESELISSRIKAAKQYAKEQGMFLGGIVPFGYKKYFKDDKIYLEEDEDKMNIVKFIVKCKTIGTKLKDINLILSKCGVDIRKNPLELSSSEDEYYSDKLNTDLTYKNIADILNSYTLGERKWTTATISNIYQKHKPCDIMDEDYDIAADNNISDSSINELADILSEDLYFS